jgi:hypothetical protein
MAAKRCPGRLHRNGEPAITASRIVSINIFIFRDITGSSRYFRKEAKRSTRCSRAVVQPAAPTEVSSMFLKASSNTGTRPPRCEPRAGFTHTDLYLRYLRVRLSRSTIYLRIVEGTSRPMSLGGRAMAGCRLKSMPGRSRASSTAGVLNDRATPDEARSAGFQQVEPGSELSAWKVGPAPGDHPLGLSPSHYRRTHRGRWPALGESCPSWQPVQHGFSPRHWRNAVSGCPW